MYWYAFTPAGTLLLETGAKKREQCIKKLLQAGAHMPYGTWENFQKRGYTLERLPITP